MWGRVFPAPFHFVLRGSPLQPLTRKRAGGRDRIKIAGVTIGSLAERAGIRAGDRILTIAGRRVRDSLDFAYLAADSRLRIELRREDGSIARFTLRHDGGRELGILPAPDPVRRCGNNCVFCFIDQNPKGLRSSLYVKDEDYRLSLLHGNYVTLTPLRGREAERIIEQHLSPLYISVHATDPQVRRRLLRSRGSAEILPLLRRLARGGIELHTQIVLVPGYNDGAVLDRTLADLEQLWPAVRTVAIVPVGLTRHRGGLPHLRRISAREARRLVAYVEQRQEAFRAQNGTRLTYLADEIYLLGGIDLPPGVAYEDFAQVENGVGLVRQFDGRLRRLRRLLARDREEDRSQQRPSRAPGRPGGAGRERVIAASGRLFAPLLHTRLESALRRTGEAQRWRVAVCPIENDLFGHRVTVAGLLGGAAMTRALRAAGRCGRVLLPPDAFNDDGVTLDEFTPERISTALRTPVQVGIGARARLYRPA